jgi:RNA polymerase-binding transcription factor DksA
MRVRHEVAPPGAVTHVPTHDADQGSAGVDPILNLGEQQRKALVEIDAALLRIERGEYGRCATCGGPVSEERLEALPQARDCETCAHVRS